METLLHLSLDVKDSSKDFSQGLETKSAYVFEFMHFHPSSQKICFLTK